MISRTQDSLVLALLAAVCLPVAAIAIQGLPPRAGLLNDYAHVIDGNSAIEIARTTRSLLRDTQAELVVVTLREVRGRDANDVAALIRQQWQVGGAEGEDFPGVVVLYSLQEGAFGISYNNLARPYLPSGALDDAFDRQARPLMQQGNAEAGIRALTRALAELLRA